MLAFNVPASEGRQAKDREMKITNHGSIIFTEHADSSWTAETKELGKIASALGEALVVAFLRLFVWADRLQSLGGFVMRLDSKAEKSYLRDLHAIAWTAAGVVYEAADAIQALEAAGIESKVSDKEDWKALHEMGERWRADTVLIRLRNNIGFHIDPKVMLKGLQSAIKTGQSITIMQGDTPKAGHAYLSSGITLLIEGLAQTGIAPKDLERAITITRDDHVRLSSLVQSVLARAMTDAGLQ